MEDFIIRFVADYLVIGIVAVGGITFLFSVRAHFYEQYVRAAVAGLTALTLAKLLSLLGDDTARPFVQMGLTPRAAYLDNPGFPSDHALFVTAIVAVLIGIKAPPKIIIPLAVAAAAVCVGRVVALVHTPLDVVGGIAAGLVGVGVWYAYDLRRKK